MAENKYQTFVWNFALSVLFYTIFNRNIDCIPLVCFSCKVKFTLLFQNIVTGQKKKREHVLNTLFSLLRLPNIARTQI